jgi:hypothetical protein
LPISSRSDDSTARAALDDVNDNASHQSVAMLRGAPVEVNTQRVMQMVSALIVATLAVTTVTFFLSGVHRNSDVSNLQQHGVSVTVTVTTCVGELGGSGSTLADYRCEGTFILGGQRRRDIIPGHIFRATGSTVTLVTATNNLGLLATTTQVMNEKSSSAVFILPTTFLAVLIAFVAVVARSRSRWRVVN